LKKGNRVFVSGRLQNRSWEGQDGQQKYMTEIVIEDMILLTSKGGFEGDSFNEDVSSASAPTPSSPPTKSAPAEDSPTPPADETPKEEKAAKKEDVGDLDDLPF